MNLSSIFVRRSTLAFVALVAPASGCAAGPGPLDDENAKRDEATVDDAALDAQGDVTPAAAPTTFVPCKLVKPPQSGDLIVHTPVPFGSYTVCPTWPFFDVTTVSLLNGTDRWLTVKFEAGAGYEYVLVAPNGLTTVKRDGGARDTTTKRAACQARAPALRIVPARGPRRRACPYATTLRSPAPSTAATAASPRRPCPPTGARGRRSTTPTARPAPARRSCSCTAWSTSKRPGGSTATRWQRTSASSRSTCPAATACPAGARPRSRAPPTSSTSSSPRSGSTASCSSACPSGRGSCSSTPSATRRASWAEPRLGFLTLSARRPSTRRPARRRPRIRPPRRPVVFVTSRSSTLAPSARGRGPFGSRWSAPSPADATDESHGGECVLVDDEEDIREVLREALEMRGCSAALAATAAEAPSLLRRQRPCPVIVDLRMPVMSGEEFAEALKHEPALAALNVTIATSSPERATPGVPVLSKPIGLAALWGWMCKTCRCGAA